MSTSPLTSRRTLVALATYNEIDNIPTLVAELLNALPHANVLIIDDNSPDGTGRYAQELATREPRVQALVRENERGLGSAVLRAFQFAIESDYDYLVNMDADFSHSVSDVPRLLSKLIESEETDEPLDVVVGSRYVPGGSTPDWSLKRRLMSRSINVFARITLGLKTHDNSGSFRCYRVSKLRALSIDSFVSTGYSFFEETLYRLKQKGAQFAEIPIVFLDRRFGASKINGREAVKAVWIMLKLGLARLVRRD